MPRLLTASNRYTQRGGITILVALMLLVLLTIAAVGMSRNSFREVVISGTTRQGAMARNVADSGLEWSIYWMDASNGANAAGTALSMQNLKRALLNDPTLAGRAWDITSATPTAPTAYETPDNNALPADLTLPAVTSMPNLQQGYTIGLTRMGKLPVADMSQGIEQGAFTPARGGDPKQAPDLWAVRSDAQVNMGPVQFIHTKEAWLSTPVGQ